MATVFGLEIHDAPETYVPLEAIVLVKALDSEGDETLLVRSTDGLHVWDRVGIAQCALDLFRVQCAAAFLSVDDDDDLQDDE